jgi:uncharacterized membrane protein (DUF4010 family)
MLPQITHFPFPPTAERLLLALALGMIVGLERERRSKEAGLRTFAFVALLGALGGLLGEAYTLVTLGLVGILVIFLNLHALHSRQVAELTTSAALLLIALAGVLCGLGHRLTPSALAVITAALLAWKRPLSGFSQALSETELRSAILLAILAFVIYPALREGKVDPWGLIDLRGALVIVILIAGIGFANYILLKLYGARGVELTGFLGGLVNSTVTVSEMATRLRETDGGLEDVAYRGVLLATAAMLLRNMILLALVAPAALLASWLPFSLMLAGGIALALASRVRASQAGQAAPDLRLESPFSIRSALQLGLVFVALQVAGTLAQRHLGEAGFYSVSVAGGLVSSSSAVASAASLAAQKTISPWVAGTGALLASLTSALVGWPLLARLSRSPRLNRRVAWSLSALAVLGLLGFVATSWLQRSTGGRSWAPAAVATPRRPLPAGTPVAPPGKPAAAAPGPAKSPGVAQPARPPLPAHGGGAVSGGASHGGAGN